MFRCIKEFLTRKIRPASPVQRGYGSSVVEEFTFESLWDDYERRTYMGNSVGPADPRLFNWIGSIDQSGYIRERCLRELIANYVPGDENRILLRLADWVPQVQSLARDWVLQHFRSLPLEAIVANQRLLLYLSRKECLRGDSDLNEITSDLLERAGSMEPAVFFKFTAMFRRFLFTASLAGDGHLRPRIVDDPEPFNRLLLLQQMEFSELSEDEVRRLAADKSVFVRRRFFYARLETGLTPSKGDLLALALDRNLSLRRLGQFYLKSIYHEDAREIYLGQMGEEFFYISDYGRKEDAEHFLTGVRSGSRSTQCNCLRALVAAAPERLSELELAALISRNRKLRSVLIPVLPRVLSLGELMALRPVIEASSQCGMVSFLQMLEKKSFWAFVDEGLGVILSDPSPTLRYAIVGMIQGRVSIYEKLSPYRRESIGSKISKLRSDSRRQNGGVADLVEFIMRNAQE